MPFLLNTTEVTDPAADRPGKVTTNIQPAGCGDIPAIKHIFDCYVRKAVAAFEIEAPDEAEMKRRWRLQEVGHKSDRFIDIALMQSELGGRE